MGADSRDFTLDISERFFHLTTESLRLHSNSTKCYQTLENLVNSRVPGIEKIDDEDAENLKRHLVAVPTGGSIQIHLEITETSAKNLERIKELLETRLETNIWTSSINLARPAHSRGPGTNKRGHQCVSLSVRTNLVETTLALAFLL